MTATNGLANFVLVFVGAIFIASDPHVYRRGLLLLMPRKAEPTVGAALDDASRGLRGWMMGQAVSSLVVARTDRWRSVGRSVYRPLVAWASSLACSTSSRWSGPSLPASLPFCWPSPSRRPAALWTVGLFLLVQQLQGNFLQPMIQKQAVDVPPAVLLFAVVAAGSGLRVSWACCYQHRLPW